MAGAAQGENEFYTTIGSRVAKMSPAVQQQVAAAMDVSNGWSSKCGTCIYTPQGGPNVSPCHFYQMLLNV